MRLQVTAPALRESLHQRFKLATVAVEVHRLGAADFLIDLGRRPDSGRPLRGNLSATHFMSVRLRTVLKELTGVGPMSPRNESLKWQIA